MGLVQWHWLILLFASVSSCCGLSSDGLALLDLSRSLILPSTISSSWSDQDATPCTWNGVQCEMNNVTGLNLSDFGVSGSIGPEVGRLKYLKLLDLSSNNISGSIPSELGNCTLLTDLYLGNNRLSGEIPTSLGNLKKLSRLILNNNSLSGSIPSSVGEMTSLVSLLLDQNMLSGVVPDSIGNCTKLEDLYLINNTLNGSLPETLSNIQGLRNFDAANNSFAGDISFRFKSCKLEIFALTWNRISGQIPGWLGNCSSLNTLGFSSNHLTGWIPASLGLLRNLSHLFLSDNSLSGSIPPEIGNCRSLVELALDRNHLEGTVPKELANLSNLRLLFLWNNRLTGDFPQGIWGIRILERVYIENNTLSGQLPPVLAESKHLQNVTLFDNFFTGVIPPGFGSNSPLLHVDFTNNRFVGGIPQNICSRKRLTRLILGHNFLTGTIPSNVLNCPSLERFILQNNRLTGQVPQFRHCANLSYIDLRQNLFSGHIPASLGKCVNITVINWSENKLVGPIPPELGELVKLEKLELSHNTLQGALPAQISRCSKLHLLDLSFNSLNSSVLTTVCNLNHMSNLRLQENKFSGGIPDCISQLNGLNELQLGDNTLGGSIPSSLGKLVHLSTANLSRNGLMDGIPPQLGNLVDLASLDLSFNNLTGGLTSLQSLRSLQVLNLSNNRFSGPMPENLLRFINSMLMSGNQGLCMSCHDGDSSCNGTNSFKPCPPLRRRGVQISLKVAVIALGSLFGVAFLVLCIFLTYRGFKTKMGSELSPYFQESSSKLNEVIESTKNFNDKYIIGTGGHGIVYKAILRSGEVYAVKKLLCDAHKILNASMIRELNMLGHIRHRNLVKLKEFLLRPEYGLILYEFMEKGSLHDVLHGTEPAPSLEWSIRYNIALGTAHGLSYLHNDCHPAIIHRDIKPKNILLDKDMVPHISDFGIAKIIDESPAASQTTGIVGTVGYMAPEMAFSTRSSIEFDVYSYGVVLLELITRKMAVDPSFPDNVDIVSWVSSMLNEGNGIESMCDPALMCEVCGTVALEEVCDVLLLALRCTSKEASERPSMMDVVKELTDARRDVLSLPGKEIPGSGSCFRNAGTPFPLPVNEDNGVIQTGSSSY